MLRGRTEITSPTQYSRIIMEMTHYWRSTLVNQHKMQTPISYTRKHEYARAFTGVILVACTKLFYENIFSDYLRSTIFVILEKRSIQK